MSRFTRKIQLKNKNPVQVVILAAGASARTQSYEPRCLLKYKGKTILEHQLAAIERHVPKSEVSVVGGTERNKFLKRLDRKIRFIENVNHHATNSGESMRLGFNHSLFDQFLFVHGDLILDEDIFRKINFDKSFVLVDSTGQIASKEVGVTSIDGNLSIFCYNMPVKWCQIAFLCQRETKIFERMLWKDNFDTTHLLSFEVINAIVENGGVFDCIDVKNKFIREIDSLKDIPNENTSRTFDNKLANTNVKTPRD